MKILEIDYNRYKGLVSNICRQITIDGWKPDYIVGITRGGMIPAVMISHYFNIKCHALHVSLRDSLDNETNCWMSEDAYGYDFDFNSENKSNPEKRKNILIVDDINDTGATINWIINDWEMSCLPGEKAAWESIWNNNVRFATLVDNMSSQCEVKMDYSSLDINKAEESVWITFFYENWWE